LVRSILAEPITRRRIRHADVLKMTKLDIEELEEAHAGA
jgi:hypothetical protein